MKYSDLKIAYLFAKMDAEKFLHFRTKLAIRQFWVMNLNTVNNMDSLDRTKYKVLLENPKNKALLYS